MYKNNLHYVGDSISPMICTINGYNMICNVINSLMGKGNKYILILTIILLIMSIMIWLLEVVIEGNILGNHSKKIQNMLMNGFILFLVSELMLFLTLFISNYLTPEQLVKYTVLDSTSVGLLNLFILLSSGVTITYLTSNKQSKYTLTLYNSLYLILISILIVIFVNNQRLEYNNSYFDITSGSYGGLFFSLTGLHGIHMIMGVLFVLFVLIKDLFHINSNTKNLSLIVTSLNLHFLDIMYIFIYFFFYL